MKSDNLQETIAFLKQTWHQFVPGRTFEFEFVDNRLEKLYNGERKLGILTGIFSVLAIFLACLGLIELAAFTVERRTREVGVRKVIGASVSSIVALITGKFIYLVIGGNLIAWPIGYVLLKDWLNQFVYGIDLHIGYFLLSGLAAGAIALLTVALQTIPAARANPAVALRDE